MKAHHLVWPFFSILILASGPCAAQAKLGFVTLERILREAPAAQRAQKKIEQEFSKRDQDLVKTAEQLKKMQEGLERNAMTMSETERQRREREFGELSRDFQRRQRDFREQLEQRRKDELSGVLDSANRAIRKIAEEEKLDIVFQSEQVVWASPRIDITDKVIKALEDAPAGK